MKILIPDSEIICDRKKVCICKRQCERIKCFVCLLCAFAHNLYFSVCRGGSGNGAIKMNYRAMRSAHNNSFCNSVAHYCSFDSLFSLVSCIAGMEMMKLFVMANTMLVFFTVAWPSIKESIYIIRDYFSDES